MITFVNDNQVRVINNVFTFLPRCIAAAVDEFYFEATVTKNQEGKCSEAKVNGVIRYHPYLFDHETHPTDYDEQVPKYSRIVLNNLDDNFTSSLYL